MVESRERQRRNRRLIVSDSVVPLKRVTRLCRVTRFFVSDIALDDDIGVIFLTIARGLRHAQHLVCSQPLSSHQSRAHF